MNDLRSEKQQFISYFRSTDKYAAVASHVAAVLPYIVSVVLNSIRGCGIPAGLTVKLLVNRVCSRRTVNKMDAVTG